MAQSKQALRSRIKSVNSTRKITKAMEMIANAKLFKQRSRMEANREYAQRLQDTVDEISANNQGLESCYLKHNGSEAKGTILFCSDLGLCGGYNQNVLRLAKELNPEDPIVVIGTSLYNQIKELGFNLVNEQSISSDRLQFSLLKQFIQILTDDLMGCFMESTDTFRIGAGDDDRITVHDIHFHSNHFGQFADNLSCVLG